MPERRSELASISTTLDELVSRVTELGERLEAERAEETAHDVFEVERSLRAGQRRLAALLRRQR